MRLAVITDRGEVVNVTDNLAACRLGDSVARANLCNDIAQIVTGGFSERKVDPDSNWEPPKPGSWQQDWAGDGRTVLFNAGGMLAAGSVCRCHQEGERGKADARIIAAAPAMLAELADSRDFLNSLGAA